MTAEAQARYRARNPEKVKAANLADREKNRERERKRAAQWYRDNPERAKEMRAASYQRNKAKRDAAAKQWKADNPERARYIARKSKLAKYGITPEDYDRMLEEQGGGCAICGKTPEEEGKNLGVDHCHSTGIVRGLLCRGCNQGLGHYRDRADWLDKASAYLRERSGDG